MSFIGREGKGCAKAIEHASESMSVATTLKGSAFYFLSYLS